MGEPSHSSPRVPPGTKNSDPQAFPKRSPQRRALGGGVGLRAARPCGGAWGVDREAGSHKCQPRVGRAQGLVLEGLNATGRGGECVCMCVCVSQAHTSVELHPRHWGHGTDRIDNFRFLELYVQGLGEQTTLKTSKLMRAVLNAGKNKPG